MAVSLHKEWLLVGDICEASASNNFPVFLLFTNYAISIDIENVGGETIPIVIECDYDERAIGK